MLQGLGAQFTGRGTPIKSTILGGGWEVQSHTVRRLQCEVSFGRLLIRTPVYGSSKVTASVVIVLPSSSTDGPTRGGFPA